MRRRVAITGMGCVTPLGAEVDTFWRRLLSGESGIDRISLFDARSFPSQIAAEVRHWDMSDVGEDPARWQHHPRQGLFAIASGLKAVRSSGVLDVPIDPLRLGVYLGCGETFARFEQFADLMCQAMESGEYSADRFTQEAIGSWTSEVEGELELNMPASYLSGMIGAQGPVLNCITACASSAQAVGDAAEMIRRGDVDVMLAGGAHSLIHPFGLTGLCRLSALTTDNDPPEKASRPFDRNRHGFVVGEGAGVVVLEEMERARSRGADILGELAGFASTQDADLVTDPHPSGRGAAAAMSLAMRDAGLGVEQIDYINAHGTGTAANDKVETLALKRAFGEHAYNIPASSTKSMLGHATTGAAAIELVICLMALRTGVVPPTINYETPDPECDLDYVPNVAREVSCQHVLSNSLGFGGQNAALVISRV